MELKPPLLELVEVSKAYDSPSGPRPKSVLAGVSLAVAARDSVGIVGPSGSGKSTLLNLMGGLDRPDRGRVLLAGENLAAMSDAELARRRNRDIGFVFQLHHLLPQCSVLENVLVPTIVSGQEAEDRARQLLSRVGLSAHLGKRPGQLSGGERQRVALVRALINSPRLLLADEPTGALDHETAATLARLLVEVNREEDVTMVVVTHSLELAGSLDRVLALRDGELVENRALERADTR